MYFVQWGKFIIYGTMNGISKTKRTYKYCSICAGKIKKKTLCIFPNKGIKNTYKTCSTKLIFFDTPSKRHGI